jgi:putative tryptophan/tyrosine transport system substrate-binding protein
LQKLGWVEGQNLIIERRFAAGDFNRLKDFAVELVRLKVNVIVASASSAAQVAKDATTSIPICFLNTGDPVGQGFVDSLAHPGGNLTGTSFDATPDVTAKQLELLIDATPKASRVAVLWNPNSPFLRSYLEAVEAAAPKLRVSLQSYEVQEADKYDDAFEAMRRDHMDAVLVLSDSFATSYRARIATLAAKHQLPALYGHSQYVQAGGLMSYGPAFSDAYRRGADYVDKILKGANPSELPVQQPTKFELIINLKVAKALGLDVPPSLLARADKVIE